MKEEKKVEEVAPPNAVLSERIKKRIMKKALEGFKPEAIRAIPQSEIQQNVDKALEGFTDVDLAIAMENSSIFCARCGDSAGAATLSSWRQAI